MYGISYDGETQISTAGLGDPAPWLVESATELGRVVQSRPAFRIDGGPAAFAWVGRPWGADPAEWAQT